MKRPHFSLPEIYDDSLSYYDVLRKLIKSMNVIIDNLNKIPEQIANEAKERLFGDQNLQQNINAESSAREQADTTLQQNINTEQTARERADQEIREGVSDKISELKGDLTNKLTQPINAKVGQIFKVQSVNEDGSLVLEAVDMPICAGTVDDVQLHGKSIVVDGVANIPYADIKTPGIVKIEPAYGISRLGNNTVGYQLALVLAPKNEIAQRSINLRIINPSNLDYSVKCAMTDGKGEAWTDAERLACLLRMGCTVDDNGFVKWTAQGVTE